MTYIVSSGVLNSTPTNQLYRKRIDMTGPQLTGTNSNIRQQCSVNCDSYFREKIDMNQLKLSTFLSPYSLQGGSVAEWLAC